MQFRLITAILASAAVSSVTAGSIQARQEGGDPAAAVVDTAKSVATPPEGGSGGSGAGLDFTQLATDAAQGAVPGGAADASNFAIPGFGGDGGININVTPPPPGTWPPPNNNYYYCQQNPWAAGCGGFRPGYNPYGPVDCRTFPNDPRCPAYYSPQAVCDPYLNCYNWDCHPTQDYYGRNSCAPVRWGAPACPCTYY